MNDQSKESSFLHSKDLTETPPPPPTQTQREEKGKENRKQEENEKSLFKIRWNDSYEFHAKLERNYKVFVTIMKAIL